MNPEGRGRFARFRINTDFVPHPGINSVLLQLHLQPLEILLSFKLPKTFNMSRILAVFLFAAIFAVASAQYYSAYVPSYGYGYSNLGYSSVGYAAYPSYAGVYGTGYAYPAYSGLAYYKK